MRSPATLLDPPRPGAVRLWAGLPAALAADAQVDRVELKVRVAPGHHESATIALDVDPLDAQMRQV